MNVSSERPVVLVTGGARRIGRAVALLFAAAGHDVAVHWHRAKSEAADLTRDIARLDVHARAFQADLTVPGAAVALATAVRAHFGRVDVVVNNASQFRPTPFLLSSQDDIESDLAMFFALHVAAPLALVRALAPGMSARGGGAVVNIGDADTVRPGHAPYVASKAALAALTQSLAHELAPRIRVNMVAPGAVLPPVGAADESVAGVLARVPMGRLGTAEEVAETVLFLATGPQFITGQIVAVDGGGQ